MADVSPFAPRPASGLEKQQVIDYLLELKGRGYEVYQAANGGRYDVILDEVHRINFAPPSNGRTQVQGFALNNVVNFFDVQSFLEFTRAIDALARKLIGARWGQAPLTGRLRQETPATNLATISRLIGTAEVQAVFDPYLENRSLSALIDILSFGAGSVAKGVRVLASTKMATGTPPRLSKPGFDAWLAQLGVTGEIRLMAPSEHRRFLLLGNGQSLLLGQSLNSLHKNEAVRLEPDVEDRAFFDATWAKAIPLV